ncbi:MAG TPA: magnesium transporter [Proteobacteria bacterium]|nr:magnesium transporter MgtE [bacterium BMS3Abin14]HDL53026.1 magnesium transporter [Pseudomonadota bacterium]
MYISKIDTLIDSIRKLVRRGANQNVKKIIEKMHAADVAYIFRYLNDNEQSVIFGLIDDPETSSELLSQLDTPASANILTRIGAQGAAVLLKTMDPDDEVSVLEEVNEDVREEILSFMSTSHSERVEELFQYPEDSAGRIMNTNQFVLFEDVTVSDAIGDLQRKGADSTEMVFYLYVIDKRNHLVGVSSLRQLLLVPPETAIKSVMTQDVVSVKPETDQEEVARVVERYDLLAVPVVDHENKLLGIVTVDDVIDVIREEATEDILKMAGTGDEYLSRSIFRRARMRFPWLLAAFVGEGIGIQFMHFFHGTLEQIIALANFLPIILAMGGNIGSTSVTIVVRGLATGRLNVKELGKVILKELGVALILGGIYGVLLLALVYIQFGDISYLGFVVGSSLLISMLMAAAVGTLMPIILHLSGVDPAVATGPFVTSTIDSLGILVYLGMATLVLI